MLFPRDFYSRIFDDLMDDAEEQKICEENCDNKCLNCWVRWARLKAREGKR